MRSIKVKISYFLTSAYSSDKNRTINKFTSFSALAWLGLTCTEKLLFSTYNTQFFIAYKKILAINILFYTLEFDFGTGKEFFLCPFVCAQEGKNNIRIKSMNQILIRLLQMTHLKSVHPVLRAHYTSKIHTNRITMERRVSERDITDICVKFVDNTKSPFQLSHLPPLCYSKQWQTKRARVIKCKKHISIWNRMTIVESRVSAREMENLFIVIVIMNCLNCYDHLRKRIFTHLEAKTSKFSTLARSR